MSILEKVTVEHEEQKNYKHICNFFFAARIRQKRIEMAPRKRAGLCFHSGLPFLHH